LQGSLVVGRAASRGTVMEVAVEVVRPGELRWRLSVVVAARRRRSRRRRRNAWTAAAAAATARSSIDRRRRRRRLYTVLYTYVQRAPRAPSPACAHLRPSSFFDIACIYIFTFSLYIPTLYIYNSTISLSLSVCTGHPHHTYTHTHAHHRLVLSYPSAPTSRHPRRS